jgi:hypothetical protein
MAWLDIVTDIVQALASVITALLATGIYSRQRRDSDEWLRREARARVDDAYFRLDSEILQSKNYKLVKELLFPEYSEHQNEIICYVYMVMDALVLEWRFNKEWDQLDDEFKKTLETNIGYIAKNIKAEDRVLLDKFEEIFCNFPQEFINEVKTCIQKIPDG